MRAACAPADIIPRRAPAPLTQRHVQKNDIIGLIWLTAGLVAAAFGVRAMLRGRAARSWPTTTGTVIKSKAEIYYPTPGDRSYHAVVRYRYTVGDNQMTSDRMGASDLSPSMPRLAARRLAAAYPVGTTCAVFYNPKNPRDAVLRTGVGGWSIFTAAIGTAMTLGGAIMLAQLGPFGR